MKTIAIKSGKCRASSVEGSKFGVRRSAGSQPSTLSQLRAFTIVELLVVIAIIGILAALLLPVLSAAKENARKKQAAVEISQIVGAIQQYDSVYGRFPVSPDVQKVAGTLGGDFTYGGTVISNNLGSLPASYAHYITNNSEVVAILMDITTNTVTHEAPNWNHQKNPQQTVFLSAKQVTDPTLPGVGPDLVYRDPWGDPYVISMDLNYDEQCWDAFYSLQSVSQKSNQTGYNGLFNPDAGGTSDNFLYHGKIMVWSVGPDKACTNNAHANVAPNQDNILSWQ